MHPYHRNFLLTVTLAIAAMLATFACAALFPPAAAKATPTPTGQIGAVEAATPGLKGNRGDYQLWSGTITSETSRQFKSNGSVVNSCTTNWLTDLDLAVDFVGDVYGLGQSTLSAPRSCTRSSNLVANTSEVSISINGRKDSSAFFLDLAQTAFKPMPSGDFGGYILLSIDGTCPGQRKSIQVKSTSSTTAEAQLDLTATMTGCGGSKDDIMTNQSLVKLQYLFKCSQLPADTANSTQMQLCQ